MTVLNVYGPPGTGKTTFLTRHFVNQVRLHGKERVGCVTYTRSAAGEFAFRAASVLNIRNPRDSLPWVGTIHSLCYGLLGRPPLVDAKAYRAFCEDEGIEPPKSSRGNESPLDLGDEDRDETEEGSILRRTVAEARHRHLPIDVVASGRRGARPDRLSYLAGQYRSWKEREGLLDFEDLLVQGMRRRLPVDVLFADESQDNSPLLWKVLDRWSAGASLFVAAGDPWQAIYVFAGADPQLFRGRPGKWLSLEESYRLRPEAATYAKATLRGGGWEDPFLDSWHGNNCTPFGVDGSKLILARTHRLIASVREKLIREGEPFGDYTRKSPLRTVAAEAYLIFARLMDGQVVSWNDFKAAATYARRYIPAADKPRRAVPVHGPSGSVTANDAVMWLGDLANAQMRLPSYDYLAKVEKNYGMRGLVLRPQTMIGTIHSAKGREADHVTLVSSWGWLPAKTLQDNLGRKREALVAYVAVSRHRESFMLEDVAFGRRYPWPHHTQDK